MSGQLKVKEGLGQGCIWEGAVTIISRLLIVTVNRCPLEPNTSEVYDWRGERTALEI